MVRLYVFHYNSTLMLQIIFLSSVIFDRLSKNGRLYESDTSRHLNEYGEAGLRTLALAYRVLDESEYSAWNTEFLKAKTTIGPDREAQVERVSDIMERELILVGATAVEDKLQKGVRFLACFVTRLVKEAWSLHLLQFPALYQQGARNLFFDWYRIIGWMFNGLYTSIVIYFLNVGMFFRRSFRSGGQTADMAAVGTTMFTCIIWAVNVQIALIMSHFTWIQHLFVWGSVATWYLFLLAYGTSTLSGNAYQILVEALGPAPIYWAVSLLVISVCNIPYLLHISYQRALNPLDHHVIQEIKYYKKDVEDQHMWKREKSKARQKTKIGVTARVDAKIRQLRGRLHKKAPSLTVQTV
ncbi:hypothetical protein BHE74_00000691 [Ensete ventricosum]|nr:hypothetical protein GW17_00000548 [Ensete ventricosum]RWW90161.1 hypothetical protein BHE74_00000691 [Ensete ventricosum]RZR76495.1 hypothetical protein BHM03_00001309 [Ensete ventricosum]